MDLGIAGRRALIAGGSSGMGRATAEALAADGVLVTISARREDKLRRAAEEIGNMAGCEVAYMAADHSTAEGRARILAACPEPDILVTTVSPPARTYDFREIDEAQWVQAFQTGAIGPIELMRGVVDGMCERKWGRIVNIITAAAKFPKELRLLSGAPRSALANYTSVVARKVSADNVVVNNLLPGIYLTESMMETRGWPKEEDAVARRQRIFDYASSWGIPSGQMGNPDDFGKVAATFCAEFADFIIGQNIVLDGGSNMTHF